MKKHSKGYSIRFISLALCFILYNVTVKAQEGWRGLVPLKSTKEDAEKLLGSQTNQNVKWWGVYKTENERVYIWYSSGNCADSYQLWKVPINTITRIDVDPRKSLLLSSLKLNFKEFEKKIFEGDTDYINYRSKDGTLDYEVYPDTEGEEVTRISYLPGKYGVDEMLCKSK